VNLVFRWLIGFYTCLSSADRSRNFQARIKSLLFCVLGALIPLLLFVDLMAHSMSRDVLSSFLGSSGTDALLVYLVCGFVSPL